MLRAAEQHATIAQRMSFRIDAFMAYSLDEFDADSYD